jgi:hypothetical protein
MIKVFYLVVFLAVFPIQAEMLIIRGANGSKEFAKTLDTAADKWLKLAEKAEIKAQLFSDKNSKSQFLAALKKVSSDNFKPLWIICLGHGTNLNGQAKLNLYGEDLSSEEMRKALVSIKKETIIINCTSTSSPFLTTLSGPKRIVITATKNPSQVYYTKFNELMVDAMANPKADLDKDGQTSLFESYLYASRDVQAFYESEKRLLGENALLDDNGDKRGSIVELFDGLNAIKPSKDLDGLRSHQIHILPSEEEKRMTPELRQKRNKLEIELYLLRLNKKKMAEEEYFEQLEFILKKLAEVYK